MKITSLAIAGLILVLGGCSAPTSTPVTGSSPAVTPVEPTDADLKALAVAYKAFPALNQELKRSDTHNGMMVRTHLDVATMQAFNGKSYPYPDGATAVKEGHMTANGPIQTLFVMKKVKGYDPNNGDWFYAMTAPDGMAMQKGKIQMCISCHTTARNQDFLYGFKQ